MNGDDIRFRYVRMTGKEELNKPFQKISGSNPIQSEILYFLELDQNQPGMAWHGFGFIYTIKLEVKQRSLGDLNKNSAKSISLVNISLCHSFPNEGWDSQNFLSQILKIFVALRLKMSWLLAVKCLFEADVIKVDNYYYMISKLML